MKHARVHGTRDRARARLCFPRVSDMMFLPPLLSKKSFKRTDRCVRCEKLTNPALEQCEHCGYAFTDADRTAMEACREERSKGSLTGLLFPIAFVLIVVLILLTM